MQMPELTPLQIAGLLLVAGGALLTYVFSRFGRRKSARLELALRISGLGLVGAGALLVFF